MSVLVKMTTVVFAGFLALPVTPTRAMDFRFLAVDFPGQSTPAPTRLVLSGEIRPGDAGRLRLFLGSGFRQNGYGEWSFQVILDSPGGDVEEALKLAQVLREFLAVVIVYPPARCASACFFLYVGAPMRGALRELRGLRGGLAVHRPFFAPEVTRRLSASKADAAHSAAFARAKRWLQDQLVPQALIDKLFSLPSTQAYWLTREDIATLGQRAAWYEEWLLARCPRYVAAEQNFEATFGTNANAAARREFEDQASCQASNDEPERMETLARYFREWMGW